MSKEQAVEIEGIQRRRFISFLNGCLNNHSKTKQK
jgi:hypothetical protein